MEHFMCISLQLDNLVSCSLCREAYSLRRNSPEDHRTVLSKTNIVLRAYGRCFHWRVLVQGSLCRLLQPAIFTLADGLCALFAVHDAGASMLRERKNLPARTNMVEWTVLSGRAVHVALVRLRHFVLKGTASMVDGTGQ